jgi:hypothetical protein
MKHIIMSEECRLVLEASLIHSFESETVSLNKACPMNVDLKHSFFRRSFSTLKLLVCPVFT